MRNRKYFKISLNIRLFEHGEDNTLSQQTSGSLEKSLNQAPDLGKAALKTTVRLNPDFNFYRSTSCW
jgi:hypothetical protein